MAIPEETIAAAFPQEKRIGSLQVHAFSLQHVLVLTKMEHPLLLPGKREISLMDNLIAVAVMGMSSTELTSLMLDDSVGPKEIRKRAIECAPQIPIESVGALIEALHTQLERGFSTFVPMRPEGGGASVPLATA